METDLQNFIQTITHFYRDTISYIPKFIAAIIVLYAGWKLSNLLIKIIKKRVSKKHIDITLFSFSTDLLNWALKITVILFSAMLMGVKTASFITFFGTIGLAIGLALQGTLTNVAGGVLLLLLKPIKVNDLIQTQSHMGYVNTIHLFTTELKTFQNEIIIIPNSQLSNERIKNYSRLGKIRIDLTIGVAYDANTEKTKAVLKEALREHPKVMREPPPEAGLLEFADSSVNFSVRSWCKPNDYWEVYFGVQENIKKHLDLANIEIPFPQRVVHQYKHYANEAGLNKD